MAIARMDFLVPLRPSRMLLILGDRRKGRVHDSGVLPKERPGDKVPIPPLRHGRPLRRLPQALEALLLPEPWAAKNATCERINEVYGAKVKTFLTRLRTSLPPTSSYALAPAGFSYHFRRDAPAWVIYEKTSERWYLGRWSNAQQSKDRNAGRTVADGGRSRRGGARGGLGSDRR
jgi:hypothetical protein